ncbi:YcgL domain-containing protein [Alteromonas sp. AMM-1]|uniref:YcgL domain-containing protein n=1 Tax=Alteromonas sp. AMM-1 TaxID=3394233 RepID=UPI0039A4456A
MLLAVYKTAKKAGMYLYVAKKDDFSAVPEALMSQFGRPQLVMMLPLSKREALGGVDKSKLIDAINDKGFYLQMPPKEENLLEVHRESLGLDSKPSQA